MKVLLCHPNQKVTYEGMRARPMVGPPLRAADDCWLSPQQRLAVRHPNL